MSMEMMSYPFTVSRTWARHNPKLEGYGPPADQGRRPRETESGESLPRRIVPIPKASRDSQPHAGQLPTPPPRDARAADAGVPFSALDPAQQWEYERRGKWLHAQATAHILAAAAAWTARLAVRVARSVSAVAVSANQAEGRLSESRPATPDVLRRPADYEQRREPFLGKRL